MIKVHIKVQEEAFDTGELTDHLAASSPKVGGVCTFVGVVRDLNEGDNVTGLFLEHYPGMTEKQISGIITEAAERWDLYAATVVHRIGQLHPTDQIVFVGAAGAHRGESFDACEFIMDYLKTRATFWKKETTEEGDRWLTTRASDVTSAESWKQS